MITHFLAFAVGIVLGAACGALAMAAVALAARADARMRVRP